MIFAADLGDYIRAEATFERRLYSGFYSSVIEHDLNPQVHLFEQAAKYFSNSV